MFYHFYVSLSSILDIQMFADHFGFNLLFDFI